jgi:hypothetical protein
MHLLAYLPSPKHLALGVVFLPFFAWLGLSVYLVSGLFGRRQRDLEHTKNEPMYEEFKTEV